MTIPLELCKTAETGHPLLFVKQMYDQSTRDGMVKVVSRSGLGQKSTYLPRAINPMFGEEPKNDMTTAMMEAKTVMCGAVEELLTKTGQH